MTNEKTRQTTLPFRSPACVNLINLDDLDLDSITSILDLDQDILKACPHTTNIKFLGQSLQKLESKQDRQTTRPNVLPSRIREW